jgi:hypothetical protein
MHSRRLFQGPGLPPSNAVQPYPFAGDPPLPRDYHQARRGISTFLFRFPIPSSAPSAISFGSGLARVRYEVRASVGVAWKGEKRLVTDKKEVDIVESYEEDFGRVEPEGVIIGENGKLWTQGRIVGGVIVGGESACVELQVKNHSNKKVRNFNTVLASYVNGCAEYWFIYHADTAASSPWYLTIRASTPDLGHFNNRVFSGSRVHYSARCRRSS